MAGVLSGTVFLTFFETLTMKKHPGSISDKKKPDKSAITSKEKTKKDMDDLVHSNEEDQKEMEEQDPDDLVHQRNKSRFVEPDKYDNPEDPDDLVHGYPEEED
jgi:hypothetical protein